MRNEGAYYFRRAKLLLRKKRFIEEQLKKTDGTLENVEKMIEDLEFAQIQMKVSVYNSMMLQICNLCWKCWHMLLLLLLLTT